MTITILVPRHASAPSVNQFSNLVDILVAKPWLATGHARTANARIRNRESWCEIATTLNSDGSGCVKTWEQWSKYWKDKKGAIKRKLSIIAAARRRTGGGVEVVPELNATENKIVMLMGGEGFATGDRHLDINPFQEPPAAEDPPQHSSSDQSIIFQISQPPPPPSNDNTQSHLQWAYTNAAELGEGSERPVVNLSPPPVPSSHIIVLADVHPPPRLPSDDETISLPEQSEGPFQERTGSTRRGARGTRTLSLPRRMLHRPREPLAPSSPRGRGSMAPRRARRLLHREPPSQRRSEMVTLTDRFIAIEERRVEMESSNIRANEEMAQAVNRLAESFDTYASSNVRANEVMAQAVNRLAESFHTCTQSMNDLVVHLTR